MNVWFDQKAPPLKWGLFGLSVKAEREVTGMHQKWETWLFVLQKEQKKKSKRAPSFKTQIKKCFQEDNQIYISRKFFLGKKKKETHQVA